MDIKHSAESENFDKNGGFSNAKLRPISLDLFLKAALHSNLKTAILNKAYIKRIFSIFPNFSKGNSSNFINFDNTSAMMNKPTKYLFKNFTSIPPAKSLTIKQMYHILVTLLCLTMDRFDGHDPNENYLKCPYIYYDTYQKEEDKTEDKVQIFYTAMKVFVLVFYIIERYANDVFPSAPVSKKEWTRFDPSYDLHDQLILNISIYHNQNKIQDNFLQLQKKHQKLKATKRIEQKFLGNIFKLCEFEFELCSLLLNKSIEIHPKTLEFPNLIIINDSNINPNSKSFSSKSNKNQSKADENNKNYGNDNNETKKNIFSLKEFLNELSINKLSMSRFWLISQSEAKESKIFKSSLLLQKYELFIEDINDTIKFINYIHQNIQVNNDPKKRNSYSNNLIELLYILLKWNFSHKNTCTFIRIFFFKKLFSVFDIQHVENVKFFQNKYEQLIEYNIVPFFIKANNPKMKKSNKTLTYSQLQNDMQKKFFLLVEKYFLSVSRIIFFREFHVQKVFTGTIIKQWIINIQQITNSSYRDEKLIDNQNVRDLCYSLYFLFVLFSFFFSFKCRVLNSEDDHLFFYIFILSELSSLKKKNLISDFKSYRVIFKKSLYHLLSKKFKPNQKQKTHYLITPPPAQPYKESGPVVPGDFMKNKFYIFRNDYPNFDGLYNAQNFGKYLNRININKHYLKRKIQSADLKFKNLDPREKEKIEKMYEFMVKNNFVSCQND